VVATNFGFDDDAITEESRKELTKFLEYMSKMGYIPTIIGGWAVWSLVGETMSQDIDAVIYDEDTYYRFIEDKYFQDRHYEQWGKGSELAYWAKKVIDKNGKIQQIRFDVVFANEPQIIRKLKIVKDWSLIIKNQQQVSFDGLTIYIPIIELLIVLKIIAALERREDQKLESRPDIISWFEGKIEKDYLDIAWLIKKKKLEKKLLKEFYIKTKLQPHLSKFINGYRDAGYEERILKRVQIEFNTIKNALTM
jgi:hypothetical protein